MEREEFISGYCRTADQSRMVSVELEDRELVDVGCCYGSCAYEADCKIAQRIRELTEK